MSRSPRPTDSRSKKVLRSRSLPRNTPLVDELQFQQLLQLKMLDLQRSLDLGHMGVAIATASYVLTLLIEGFMNGFGTLTIDAPDND